VIRGPCRDRYVCNLTLFAALDYYQRLHFLHETGRRRSSTATTPLPPCGPALGGQSRIHIMRVYLQSLSEEMVKRVLYHNSCDQVVCLNAGPARNMSAPMRVESQLDMVTRSIYWQSSAISQCIPNAAQIASVFQVGAVASRTR